MALNLPRGQSRTEGKLVRILTEFYRDALFDVVEKIADDPYSLFAYRSASLQPLRDAQDGLDQILLDHRAQAARYGRNRIERSMGGHQSGEYPDPRVDQFPSAKMFTDRVIRDVNISIDRVEDEPREDTLQRVIRRLSQVVDGEIRRLARMEASYGESFGAYHTMLDYNVFAKRWKSTLVGETRRKDHIALHDMVIKLEDRFPNGLLFPGDLTSGLIKEVANCQCWIVPATREELSQSDKPY